MKYIRRHKQIIEESWFSDISIPNNPISNSLKGTELSIDISISDLSSSYKLNANNEYLSTLVTRIAGHVIENYIVKKLGLSYTSSVLDGSREENGQTVEYEIKAYKDSLSSFLKIFSAESIALFKSELITKSISLKFTCSFSSKLCLIPFSLNLPSSQPVDLCSKLSVVVPCTK